MRNAATYGIKKKNLALVVTIYSFFSGLNQSSSYHPSSLKLTKPDEKLL